MNREEYRLVRMLWIKIMFHLRTLCRERRARSRFSKLKGLERRGIADATPKKSHRESENY
jgi:hypothetical protein